MALRILAVTSMVSFTGAVARAEEPPPPPRAAAHAEARRGAVEGMRDGAEARVPPKWYGIGFGGGCIAPGVGCIAASAFAQYETPLPAPPELRDVSPEYSEAYRAHYVRVATEKRARRTCVAGGVGTIAAFYGVLLFIALMAPHDELTGTEQTSEALVRF